MIKKIVLLSVVCFLLFSVSLVAEVEQTGIIGDVNDDGEVTEFDASLILRYLETGYPLSANQQALADVNEDGAISHEDAILIMQEQVSFFQEETLEIAPVLASLASADAVETFAPRITFPPQGNIFYSETIVLSGIAPPNEYIYIFKNQDTFWTGQTTVKSNGYWSIGFKAKETGTIVYTVKMRQRNKGWLASNPVIVKRQHPPSDISLFLQVIPGAVGQVAKNVVYGKVENIAELPANILIDVIAVGDIRDTGQQAYYWITGSKEYSPLVLGTSVLGIVTTVAPVADITIASIKETAKFTVVIARQSPSFAKAIRYSMKALAQAKDVSGLKSLAYFSFKVQSRNVKILEKTAKSAEDISRFSKYVGQYGDEGLDLAEQSGKWIGERIDNFPDSVNHLKLHKDDTGIPWLGRTFANVPEYESAAKEVMANPQSKKILYYYWGKLDDPTLGYAIEKNGSVFLVSIGKEGTIKTFFRVDKGWDYFNNTDVFVKPFRVDNF